MALEKAAITLGINVEEVDHLAHAVGADFDDLGPEDLVAMASLLGANTCERR